MSLAVVQSGAHGSNNSGIAVTVTLGAAPTQGNLLLATGFVYNNPPLVNTGWTILNSLYFKLNGSVNAYATIYWKYAGAGESTSQTPDTTTGINSSITMWEISGVSGKISDDFAEIQNQNPFDYPTTSGTLTSFTNVANPELLLMGCTANTGGANDPITITGGSPSFTADQSAFGANGAGDCSAYAFHASFGSTGNTVNPSFSISTGGSLAVGLIGLTTSNPSTTPKVVQTASKCVPSTGAVNAVFPVAPTNGNLLVAICSLLKSAGAPTANTGWTLDTSTDNGTYYIATFYKYAGVGESTTQTPDATSRSIWQCVIHEVSGVTGTWGTDHKATTLDQSANASGTTRTPTPITTVANKEVVLGGVMGSVGSGVQSPAYQNSTGVYNAGSTSQGGGTGNSAQGFHYLAPSSGTSIAPAYSVGLASWFSSALVEIAAVAATDNGNVALALTGVSFNVHEQDDHAGVTLPLTKVSFAGSAVRTESGNASITVGGVSFGVTEKRHSLINAAMALSGVTIKATALNLGAAGAGSVHFSTFGA